MTFIHTGGKSWKLPKSRTIETPPTGLRARSVKSTDGAWELKYSITSGMDFGHYKLIMTPATLVKVYVNLYYIP